MVLAASFLPHRQQGNLWTLNSILSCRPPILMKTRFRNLADLIVLLSIQL